MSTPRHTPGPWTVKDEDTVVGPQGNTIAECCGYSIRATNKDQIRQGGREANAKFIAAAPAMYEALSQVQAFIKTLVEADVLAHPTKLTDTITNALAQAEGK